MDTGTKIKYWLDIAGYDLDTANAMLNTSRYLYVGFFCHQTIEKSIKAYYWNTINSEPPYTHNLLLLAEQSQLKPLLTESRDRLLNRLMPLNIQARYPQDREELMKTLTNSVCRELLLQTEDFFAWIKQLLIK